MVEHAVLHIGRYQQLPLVGRNYERSLLHQSLIEAELQHAQEAGGVHNDSWTLPVRKSFTLLKGEVGIGKTRLAEEAAREALQRGWSVLWSRAYAQESSVPYRLWSEILRDIMRRDLWPLHAENLHARFQVLTVLLPELSELFPGDSTEVVISTVQEAQHLRDALLALLLEIVRQQDGPLLIVLDDLQWADKSSCELLGYLARRLVDHPVLLVGTVRENEMPSTHPLWALTANMQRERVITVLHIEALTDEQIAALVAHVPPSFALLIQHQVAGNPFFAEELARMCSAWEEIEASEPEIHNRLILPRTIADVLDQRLQRLSSPCQRFLQHATVLGSSLSFDSLRLMESSSNSTPDEDNLFTMIEEALHAKVLTEEQVGNSITYHFWHPLLMSHLYEKVSGTRRARLHRKAADVFCRIYAAREEEGAAIITHHLVAGGADAERIATYAELAGDHAYVLAAYPAAEHYYRLASEQVQLCIKNGALNDARLRLASLWERLGECVRFQGNFQEACHYFELALELHRQHYPTLSMLPSGDGEQEAQMQAMLCCQIGVCWYDRNDYVRAQQYYGEVEAFLKATGIVAGPAWAYLLLQYSFLYWRKGAYVAAGQAVDRALELFQCVLDGPHAVIHTSLPTRLRRTLVGDPVDLGRTYIMLGLLAGTAGQVKETTTYFNRALILTTKGQPQDGDLHFEKAMQLFHTCSMKLEYARTLQLYGSVLIRRDPCRGTDYQRGTDYLLEARSLFAEYHAKNT